MGYRIFYSYQSDIEKRLNQAFIRDAINESITRIKEFPIEPLIEGFYGVGGNPPLAETMLKQSKDADIFIGDVTFTSSKIWQSQGVNFHEDKKSYLIEIDKPMNLKPAPNPNVLLETGYSWALKSHKRTILVLNKAFGAPSELPVDMKGLRWPIIYNLCENRYNKAAKLKKEKESLVTALEFAIREAINSSIEYQVNRWRPLQINGNWKKDHNYPFQLTKAVQENIIELRSQIFNSRSPIRVCGLRGCGKTRLVLEVFQAHGDVEYHSMNEQVVYHDYGSALSGDISKQLSELIDLEHNKLFIADNCSYENHILLSKLFRNTRIKLVTINTIKKFDENDGATFIVKENLTFDIFEKIISIHYPKLLVEEVIGKFEHNLSKFISLIEAGVSEDELYNPSIDLLKILIGKEMIEAGALKLLSSIALFDKIGISGEYRNQLDLIRTTFVFCSENELTRLIEYLISKRFIFRIGDFVVVTSFKDDLITYWKNQPINDINTLIINVSEYKMWNNFGNKLMELICNANENYIDILNGAGGVFHNHQFIDSNKGGEFLNLLVDYFPLVGLDIIQSKFERSWRR